MPGIATMVLAAGASTRMGKPKQLLRYAGKSFLRHAGEVAVEAGCHPIIVVLGCQAEEISTELAGLPVLCRVNPDWQMGIGNSIRFGASQVLEHSPMVDAILILLADQPLVHAGHLNRLVEAFGRLGKEVCLSRYADTIGPPAIVGRSLFSALMSIPDSQGAKSLWAAHPDIVAGVDCASAAFDIDTPSDYEQLVRSGPN